MIIEFLSLLRLVIAWLLRGCVNMANGDTGFGIEPRSRTPRRGDPDSGIDGLLEARSELHAATHPVGRFLEPATPHCFRLYYALRRAISEGDALHTTNPDVTSAEDFSRGLIDVMSGVPIFRRCGRYQSVIVITITMRVNKGWYIPKGDAGSLDRKHGANRGLALSPEWGSTYVKGLDTLWVNKVCTFQKLCFKVTYFFLIEGDIGIHSCSALFLLVHFISPPTLHLPFEKGPNSQASQS
ncbi:hypothetical protein BS47DRAFT_1385290 [Hydnum rufescens UP504]|uniref:Secreted protein n=1 Tax=Hydnum rufescens UP504 TaxID=1448309 RepID=A0A9P6DQ73_9AGAM|nr:hypothetical protein BS47DRAFT_1385290 [Hydnum rufescens UP504]